MFKQWFNKGVFKLKNEGTSNLAIRQVYFF